MPAGASLQHPELGAARHGPGAEGPPRARIEVGGFRSGPYFPEEDDAMSKKPLPVDAVVGHNIRAFRLERGLKQAELGEYMGVTLQQIQKYETGLSRVSASRLSQISEALDVPLSELFNEKRVASRRRPDVLVGALLADPNAIRLLRAFHKIPARKTRIALLHLFEGVGEMQRMRGRSPRGRRMR